MRVALIQYNQDGKSRRSDIYDALEAKAATLRKSFRYVHEAEVQLALINTVNYVHGFILEVGLIEAEMIRKAKK